MPELPEVEVLVRHLAPLIKEETIHEIEIHKPRVIAPTSEKEMRDALTGATFTGLTRRGKYLVFTLRGPKRGQRLTVLGHLGMTGRMYFSPQDAQTPKHAAIVLICDTRKFVYEDPRGFGRFTLDTQALAKLGPEPLGKEFTAPLFASKLPQARQNIKMKLLDQKLVAGVGNIYASEALFQARISPTLAANELTAAQAARLHKAIREVLEEAIRLGSRLALDFEGAKDRDGLFYYGSGGEMPEGYAERFRVYDRAGEPCTRCQTPIKRLVQGARSTFYCPHCQRI